MSRYNGRRNTNLSMIKCSFVFFIVDHDLYVAAPNTL
jgi:hypothetical protein